LQSPISMQFLASPEHLALLNQHQLASFGQLWDFKGEWFEPPNRERGGWSGVNYVELTAESGEKCGVYLKRQENFMRRSLRHPIAGEPTFVREFTILQHLAEHQVNAPKVVFFAAQAKQAILMTEALVGYVDLDVWLAQNPNANIARKKNLIRNIANTVKNLHEAGVQHRSLYPKHLFIKEKIEKENFIKENVGFEVAIIDFEKSRITPLIARLKLSDLITLSRRLPQISRTQKLTFFKQYLGLNNNGANKLNASQKQLCKKLYQKSISNAQSGAKISTSQP
jgi:tRNA A-37 threonylcarbamoyl transferase component Bud32